MSIKTNISTGTFSLDIALGGKGISRGGITGITGDEGTGVSLMILSIIAQAQRNGLTVVHIGTLGDLYPEHCRRLGVDLCSLLTAFPASIQDCIATIPSLIKSKIGLIVIDSLWDFPPKPVECVDQEPDNIHSRLHTAIREIHREMVCCPTAILLSMPNLQRGLKDIQLYLSALIRLEHVSVIKDGDDTVGQEVRCTVIRNKKAIPGGIANIRMIPSQGIVEEIPNA
jgi:recombination protein RecA